MKPSGFDAAGASRGLSHGADIALDIGFSLGQASLVITEAIAADGTAGGVFLQRSALPSSLAQTLPSLSMASSVTVYMPSASTRAQKP